jgi:hypothetical protein
MSFGDDDIYQSLDYYDGEAGSLCGYGQRNSRNRAIDVGCSGMDDFCRHDSGMPHFNRHYITFGGKHQSAVAWINTSTHEAGITDYAGINSNTNNMLDLATVASLFSIGHSIDSNKSPPSNNYNSPTAIITPAQSKAAIVSDRVSCVTFLYYIFNFL